MMLGPTQAFAGKFDAMSVVDTTVQTGVGVGSWEVITVERRP
jgi:hypothetical protein